MRIKDEHYLWLISSIFILSGCVVRTYPLTKDRVDQELNAGNRGYLKGRAPYSEAKETKKTRTTQVIEIELHPPIKFEKMPKQKLTKKIPDQTRIEEREDQELWGNRGFITQRYIPKTEEQQTPFTGHNMRRYTVEKDDTLQKISKQVYGTTKKWTKIYDANEDVLKSPNKIYPGQVINIPIEPLKETKENLK